MKKIKRWDRVEVISGKHKKAIATVERVDGDFVYLEGVNVVQSSAKSRTGESQGFTQKTLPLHVSNVMYYDEEAKKRSRVQFVFDDKGKKQRKLTSTGRTLAN